MLPVPKLTDTQIVFGARPPLPKWADIPETFHRHDDPFVEIVSTLFFSGGKFADFGLTPKPGVDLAQAHRAITCCLRSFEPKHEHKTAGVAYMLSEWFDRSEREGSQPNGRDAASRLGAKHKSPSRKGAP